MSDLEVHLSTDDVTLVNNSLEIHLSTDDELTSNLSVGYIGTADLTDYVTKSELKDKGYLTAVPSEYVTESELNAKGYLTEHQDLSGYAKTSSIPTKTSQLTNDSGYLKSIPSEYVTESELNAKGLATETFVTNKIAEASLGGGEVDLSGYVTKDDLSGYAEKTDIITPEDLLEPVESEEPNFISMLNDKYDDVTLVNNSLEFSSNTVVKKKVSGLATETFVANKIAEASLSGGEVDLSGYATKDELSEYAKTSSIPTKTSQLSNDSGYLKSIPSEYVTDTELNAKGYLTEHQDLSEYAKTSSIPTKTSQLSNDSGYLTAVPSEYVTDSELNDKGYLTEHQDLSEYAKTSNIPTKTSQLTNDSGYLTSVPSEYVTDTELNAKGLATETFVTNKIAEASLSGGSGTADTVDGFHIWYGTQASYDLINPKDSSTIYLISG